MLSNRCYMILSLLNTFHALGFTWLSFNTTTLLTTNDSLATSRQYHLPKLNYALCLAWNIVALTILLKLYLLGDVDLYVTGAFCLALILITIVLTILVVYSRRFSEQGNCLFKFFRYLHSKHFNYFYEYLAYKSFRKLIYTFQKYIFQNLTRRRTFSIGSLA